MPSAPAAPPLESLTLDFFSGRVGARFTLRHPGGELELALAECRGLGWARPGGREAFTLLFVGPPAPVVAQQMVTLVHPEFRIEDLFVVPLGPGPAGMRYEAVFT